MRGIKGLIELDRMLLRQHLFTDVIDEGSIIIGRAEEVVQVKVFQ